MNTQVAGLTFIVAQETDQTGRQITTMIVVLLAIALLLGLLTAWYWRHTDPRQRAKLLAENRRASREAEEDRRLEVGEPAIEARAPQQVATQRAPQGQAGSIWAEEPAATQATTPTSTQTATPADSDGMSADEWLRLTGPKNQNGARPSGRPATGQASEPGQAKAQQPAPRHEREA